MVIVTPKKLLAKLVFFHLIMFLFLLGLSNFSIINEEVNLSSKTYSLRINFLVPMNQDEFSKSITFSSEFPKQKPKHSISWINKSTVEIRVWDTAYPQGQEITIKINRAETKVPFIVKNERIRFRIPIEPEVIGLHSKRYLSTLEPLKIVFNVPMLKESIEKKIVIVNTENGDRIKGKLEPASETIKGEYFQDDSTWFFQAEKGLKPNANYNVVVESGITSKSGKKLKRSYEKTVTIASKPEFIKHIPVEGAKNVSLYPDLELTANETLKSGKIALERHDQDSNILVRGSTLVKGNKIAFQSEDVLLPNSTYIVEAIGYSIHGEPTDKVSFTFNTQNMNEKYWIDVKLGDIHTVTVYKGQIVVRHMVASGGKDTTKTPLGTYYTGDKGYSFWSPRFGEGAIYWVRLVGQILFHSVPRGSNGEVKEEEHKKLGLPASHGCIRLDDNDAKWIFENIPYGTPVIIHN